MPKAMESPLMTREEFWKYCRVGETLGKQILKKHPELIVSGFGDRVFIHRERVDEMLRNMLVKPDWQSWP